MNPELIFRAGFRAARHGKSNVTTAWRLYGSRKGLLPNLIDRVRDQITSTPITGAEIAERLKGENISSIRTALFNLHLKGEIKREQINQDGAGQCYKYWRDS